jgi:DeoR family fructose operon transcriptional repressor
LLTPERHRIILELLTEKEVVKLQEFVEATGSSDSTIRRDLSQLEQENMLKRVHGGAALLHQKGEELSISEKSTKNLEEKEVVARYAASLIEEGDCIYLDAGTTVFQMIKYIEATKIKVVTNGLTHLEALLEKNINTFIVGGYIKQKTKAMIGPGAISGLEQYHFDKCFLGVNGIHSVYGLTTPDPDEASIKRLAMELSQEAYVVADYTKFHKVAFSKIADLHTSRIITTGIEEEILKDYKDKTRIKVVTS